MPKGSKVDSCFQKVRKERVDESAAKICQSATGQSLKTGKKPKKKSLSSKVKSFDTRQQAEALVQQLSSEFGMDFRLSMFYPERDGTTGFDIGLYKESKYGIMLLHLGDLFYPVQDWLLEHGATSVARSNDWILVDWPKEEQDKWKVDKNPYEKSLPCLTKSHFQFSMETLKNLVDMAKETGEHEPLLDYVTEVGMNLMPNDGRVINDQDTGAFVKWAKRWVSILIGKPLPGLEGDFYFDSRGSFLRELDVFRNFQDTLDNWDKDRQAMIDKTTQELEEGSKKKSLYKKSIQKTSPGVQKELQQMEKLELIPKYFSEQASSGRWNWNHEDYLVFSDRAAENGFSHAQQYFLFCADLLSPKRMGREEQGKRLRIPVNFPQVKGSKALSIVARKALSDWENMPPEVAWDHLTELGELQFVSVVFPGSYREDEIVDWIKEYGPKETYIIEYDQDDHSYSDYGTIEAKFVFLEKTPPYKTIKFGDVLVIFTGHQKGTMSKALDETGWRTPDREGSWSTLSGGWVIWSVVRDYEEAEGISASITAAHNPRDIRIVDRGPTYEYRFAVYVRPKK